MKKDKKNAVKKTSNIEKGVVKALEKDKKINQELVKELKDLSKEVKKIKSLEFMKVFKHPVKFMWFSFLKGLMVGFGSVLGATVVVALFIFVISKISLVPIVGDFVDGIINELEVSQDDQEKDFLERLNEATEKEEKEIKVLEETINSKATIESSNSLESVNSNVEGDFSP